MKCTNSELIKNNIIKDIEENETKDKIETVLKSMQEFLIEKNNRYGDSALNPVGIFGKHVKKGQEAANGILIRLDDKLGRIKNADQLRKNDLVDITGYLTLLLCAMGYDDFEDLID